MALTLRLLGGLTVAEIAAAFLVPETTMAQRITRSKQKIKAAGIPYRIPRAEDLPARLGAVLAVLYLVFNEGYLGSSGQAQRHELTAEAIRLARQLREMVTGTPALGRLPEVDGLLALMLLTESRSRARVHDGVLVPLDEQDRTLWDAAMIDEGHRLVRGCLALNRPGPYQVQAAINAVHTDALDASMTDWSQVVALFDQLLALSPEPGGRPQPGGGGRGGRRAGGGARPGRAARAHVVPRLARDPGRPAAPAAEVRRGAGRLRRAIELAGNDGGAVVPARTARRACPDC